MRKKAFPPIIDNESEILMLGTMPGEESLRKQEYYGNKNNQFWKLLFCICDKPFSEDYSDRINLVIENKIALWDVLETCERKGSTDDAIKNEIANNFEQLFTAYPSIKKIYFTSKNAEKYYKKYIGFDDVHTFSTLPSPSPRNRYKNFEEKLNDWKIILE